MEYGTLLMFLAVAVLLGAAVLGLNRLLMPYRPDPIKNATYECGNEPVGDAQIRYNIRFYIFALLYVIFAVEAAFLFPWAVVFREIEGLLPLGEVIVFLFILVLALAYAWKKGALQWD
ncbi:MAG: NADH-quinone oxidoreductase subunit A [Spirochaetia bacterium]